MVRKTSMRSRLGIGARVRTRSGEGACIYVHCVDGLEDEVAAGCDGILECIFYCIVICAAVVIDK